MGEKTEAIHVTLNDATIATDFDNQVKPTKTGQAENNRVKASFIARPKVARPEVVPARSAPR